MKCNVFGSAVAAVLFAALAAAQDKGPQAFDPTKAWADLQQQLLRQFDVNRDGKLTGQEQVLAQEAMRRQGINLGMPPGGFAGADDFVKQFDRDRDGKLNPQEMMAAQAAYQRMRGGGKGGGGVASGVPVGQPAFDPGAAADQKPNKVPPLIKRFDKDGDGKLNAAEKAAAQAELKKPKSKDPKENAEKGEKDKGEKGKGEKGAAKDK
jgi:Ca2+-binding EF-hand superfamily protein